MSQPLTCPSCGRQAESHARFCSMCGADLQQPLICPNCGYSNECNSKFCQECATALRPSLKAKGIPQAIEGEVVSSSSAIESPPISGITIEFPFSTAQSFDFAVQTAGRLPNFKQFGQEKKAIYRVTVQQSEMASLMDLIEHLKGWRRRVVYLNGEKVTWDSVFSFAWCYERKNASFKPQVYCFGYENDWQLNIWGCIQANLPFTDRADWFCWGRWVNNKGDWAFDKQRIRHEIEKALYYQRFCPALNFAHLEAALKALPDKVNPFHDKSWQFAEAYGETTDGLVVLLNESGYKRKAIMKGVSPNGVRALQDIAKRLKLPLPASR